MTHASLFSGVGGFDLAAEWMGWTNVFNCEWEDFPRKVLKHHFPNAIQYGDIRELDATKYRGRIDIITGGFPCQPYSMAGKRLGKDDERHLWPEMLRIIREVQPRYVVGENVLGITSWNGGLVFDEVQADMEAERYEVLPFVLPACAVNAPHRRDRVWFVARHTVSDSKSEKCKVQSRQSEGPAGDSQLLQRPIANTNIEKRKRRSSASERERQATEQRRNGVQRTIARFSQKRDAPDTDSARLQRGGDTNQSKKAGGYVRLCNAQPRTWQDFPSQPPVCGGNDGLSRELDGITFSKWRNESIKAYGNAIVPQVALQIFKAIQETDRHD